MTVTYLLDFLISGQTIEEHNIQLVYKPGSKISDAD